MVLTDALEQLNSTSVLCLGEGTHLLTRHTPIFSQQDIFILGSERSEVIVRCDYGIGLSFVNVNGLTLCGFTIDGCSLTAEPISKIEQQLKEVTMLWFGVPSIVSYGMVLGHCWNVTLSDLLITNTVGMGLLGINVLGDSILHRVSFTYNIRHSCRIEPPRYPFDVSDDSILKQIGGGAYFLYQDEVIDIQGENIPVYNLVVRDSTFSHNAECSYAAITQVNFQQFPTSGPGVYQVGAGGGLSVFVSQGNFYLHTLVENSTFTENDARYGAGAHISVFAGVEVCNVTFRGCTFERNGIRTPDRINAVESSSVGGSGLVVFTDLLSPNKLKDLLTFSAHNVSVIVRIIDTNFVSNVAGVEGGGLLVYSLFTAPHCILDRTEPGYYTILINIENCVFHNNSAQYGIAAYFQQNVHQGDVGSMLLTFSNTTFSNSKAGVDVDLSTFRFLQQVSGQKITSAVALLNVIVAIRGRVVVSDNEVTGILFQSTPVLVHEGSQVLMERNSGQQGGGVHIAGEGAGIGFDVNTEISFLNNTASIYGGAVYVSPSINSNDVLRPIDSAIGCFISPFPRGNCFQKRCFNYKLDNVSIRFAGNFAPIGSIVYGSTLESCTWAIPFENTFSADYSLFQILDIASTAIDFDVRPNSSSVVSTPPASMSVLGTDNMGPGNGTLLEVFPGQGVNLSIEVFDQFGYTIPATVTSYVLDTSMKFANSSLGGSGFFFTGNDTTTTILTITGQEEQMFPVFFTELSNLVSTNLIIRTLPCLQGFTFDGLRCTCNDQLVGQGVMCDLDKIRLISADKIWVGNLTANASTEELVVSTCSLGYCNEGTKPFRPPYYHEQCSTGSNRTGVLCGHCMPGFSVVLGNRECRKCTNLFLLLIPLFGFLGIALFVAIAFLEVTVEKGWMYLILFYSNVVTLSSLSQSLPARWDIIYVPANLLSFELGIGMCLYDGMETIDRVLLKLLFPLYLIILMFIFSLLSKKFTFSGHFSPVKTFATLGVMSYTSILDTCVEIVTATNLRTVSGERHLRWLADPNVIYFRGFHCVLVLIAAMIFVIYLIPVPLVLLSPQIAFNFFKKIGPLFDALWAPFKPKYRWWLGARLVLRALLFFSTGFLPDIGNFVSVLVLLIMMEIQFIIRPFKMETVNIVDNIIIGDIIALIIGVFFFTDSGDKVYGPIYTVATILFGYALIIGILVHHFWVIWRLRSRVKKWYAHMKKTRSEKEAVDSTMSTVSAAAEQDELTTTATPTPKVKSPSHSSFTMGDSAVNSLVKADFSHLRESILES